MTSTYKGIKFTKKVIRKVSIIALYVGSGPHDFYKTVAEFPAIEYGGFQVTCKIIGEVCEVWTLSDFETTDPDLTEIWNWTMKLRTHWKDEISFDKRGESPIADFVPHKTPVHFENPFLKSLGIYHNGRALVIPIARRLKDKDLIDWYSKKVLGGTPYEKGHFLMLIPGDTTEFSEEMEACLVKVYGTFRKCLNIF